MRLAAQVLLKLKLKGWWSPVNAADPEMEYNPHVTKSVLIVDPGHCDRGGQRHSSAVIGTEVCEEYVGDKVAEWVKEIGTLAAIAKTEPHYLFSVHRHQSSASVHSSEQWRMPPLVKSHALWEKDMLALPPRLGGMGITSPGKLADKENQNSISFTRSLTNRTIAQEAEDQVDQSEIREIKRKISEERHQPYKDELDHLTCHLSTEMGRKNPHSTGGRRL